VLIDGMTAPVKNQMPDRQTLLPNTMKNKPVPTTSIARSDSKQIFIREADLVEELIERDEFHRNVSLSPHGQETTSRSCEGARHGVG